MSAPIAVGLDLGSTRIKAALLGEDGLLLETLSVAAPPIVGDHAVRTSDAESYRRAADELLDRCRARVPAGTPLGLACQRSSFTIWGADDGRPRTPLISWQDRSAAGWCRRNASLDDEIAALTGLRLSAHYVGPKLADLRERNPALVSRLESGELRFGTLDTFLTWHWTAGRVHTTDPTMAARTSMFDIHLRDWSDRLLEHYGVRRDGLPVVAPTSRRGIPLDDGLRLEASIADQAAAALSMLEPDAGSVLVNLGTGAFVLGPLERPTPARTGYLLAPIDGSGETWRWVSEGPINGAGAAVDRVGGAVSDLPAEDPSPRAFCIPDLAGLGAPYWMPDVGFELSSEARTLDADGRRRIVIEGVLFRVREILDELYPAGPDRIVLAGGLSRDPAVATGLATLLDRPVGALCVAEAGLLGATRLAAGMRPFAAPPTRTVRPSAAGAYLPRKFTAWRRWLGRRTGG